MEGLISRSAGDAEEGNRANDGASRTVGFGERAWNRLNSLSGTLTTLCAQQPPLDISGNICQRQPNTKAHEPSIPSCLRVSRDASREPSEKLNQI